MQTNDNDCHQAVTCSKPPPTTWQQTSSTTPRHCQSLLLAHHMICSAVSSIQSYIYTRMYVHLLQSNRLLCTLIVHDLLQLSYSQSSSTRISLVCCDVQYTSECSINIDTQLHAGTMRLPMSPMAWLRYTIRLHGHRRHEPGCA